jgi:hypothetical protein
MALVWGMLMPGIAVSFIKHERNRNAKRGRR